MSNKLKQIWIEYIWKNAISWFVGIILAALAALAASMISIDPNKTPKQIFHEVLDFKVDLKTIFIVLLLLAFFYLMYFLFFKFKYTDSTKTSDIELFNKIRNQYLDQDHTIRYLREVSFRGSFSIKSLDGLDDFNNKCKNSDFRFLNPKLEKLKIQLLKESKILMDCIAMETFSVSLDIQRIPKEWEYEVPNKFNALVQKMNDSADNICLTYDQFIVEGRSELGI